MKSKGKKVKRENRHTKLVSLLDPKSPISEAYRTLRTNIHFSGVDKNMQVLMATSSGAGEGKTTTISNLAIVLAQQDKKVILVDVDLRKPTIHQIFRVPNRVGLTNILADAETIDSVTQKSINENLSIITSGPIPPNPAEMLSSRKMEQVVKSLINNYDYVLFDAPPVIAVTDAQILSQLVDGVLLVISSGNTEKEMALKAKALLDNVKANVIGVVLNNKKNKKDDYYYYYYYNN